MKYEYKKGFPYGQYEEFYFYHMNPQFIICGIFEKKGCYGS